MAVARSSESFLSTGRIEACFSFVEPFSNVANVGQKRHHAEDAGNLYASELVPPFYNFPRLNVKQIQQIEQEIKMYI